MNSFCPRCFTPDCLRLVGAYVYSAEGAEDSPTFQVDEFNLQKALVSQKLYRCTNCEAHISEADLVKGKELASKTIFWDTNSRGGKIPISCPICKNAVGFYKKSLVLMEQENPVQVMSAKEVHEDDNLVTRILRERVPLSYRCMTEGCTGEIVVNEDDYFIKKLPLSDS